MKADTIEDQTKEIDQDKDNFKGEDKDKDNHTETEIIVQDKIGEKMEDIKIRDMKEEINNTIEKDLTPILHQEDLLKESIKTEDLLETINKTRMTTGDIKEIKFLKVEDRKMMK